MKHSVIASDVEAHFDVKDLIISRTDERGLIQSFNDIFQKIAKYPADTLKGAPQNIVRHDDMPKGVFYLLWQTIQAGEPIGAYVKNMSADGSFYWVYATVLPIEGGYLSLRMKPTGRYLEKVIPLYQTLRQAEKEENLTPDASAERLLAAVRAMGFADYTEFMGLAMYDEATSRDRLLGRHDRSVCDMLSEMLDETRKMETQAGAVESTFKNTHQIHHNMRLVAGRLEGSGGPISVISGNHRMMTQSLEANLARFSSHSTVGAGAIRLALLMTGVAVLIKEAASALEAERDNGLFDRADELRRLRNLAHDYGCQSAHEARAFSERARRFGDQCNDMRRMMSGLELTRIMCKIERSKYDSEQGGLEEVVNRLAEAQDTLGRSFDDIIESVRMITSHSAEIEQLERIA